MMHAHEAMNHLRNTNLFPNRVHKSHINLDILYVNKIVKGFKLMGI